MISAVGIWRTVNAILHLQRFTMITGVMYYAGFTHTSPTQPTSDGELPRFRPRAVAVSFRALCGKDRSTGKCFCEGKTDLASHASSPRKLASSTPLALVRLVLALWTVAWHEQVVQAPIYARPR